MCIHISLYVFKDICLYVGRHIYLWTYIYIVCMYMYICIYVYMYIFLVRNGAGMSNDVIQCDKFH